MQWSGFERWLNHPRADWWLAGFALGVVALWLIGTCYWAGG